MYYVIADTHINHQLLIDEQIRPRNYELKIAKSIQRLLPGDTLIHLGDVSFGDNDNAIKHFTALSECKKILVFGNHDKNSPRYYQSRGFDFVCQMFTLKRFGKHILFSHEPLPLPDYIDVNIHGHLHGLEHRESPYPDSRHILVSLEKDGYRAHTLKSTLNR